MIYCFAFYSSWLHQVAASISCLLHCCLMGKWDKWYYCWVNFSARVAFQGDIVQIPKGGNAVWTHAWADTCPVHRYENNDFMKYPGYFASDWSRLYSSNAKTSAGCKWESGLQNLWDMELCVLSSGWDTRSNAFLHVGFTSFISFQISVR